MKIALPTAGNALCMHFGHCEEFVIVTVDQEAKSITGKETATPPPHEPGVLPRWLKEKGVDLVIAGGMGMRAQQLFTQYGITVLVGAPADHPQTLVQSWLEGTLACGANVCDH